MIPSARVLVVDDQAEHDRLFNDAFSDLTICPTISALESRLHDGETWDVAFVDFALTGPVHPESDRRTGLTGLRLLRAERPATKLVSYTQPGESGRQLYMAAAKEWFAADATAARSMLTVESVMSLVDGLRAGRDPTAIRLKRWLEHSHLIRRLVKNENYVELWRRWNELNGNESAISQITHLSTAQVRTFRESVYEAVLDFKQRFEGVDLRTGTSLRGNTNYKGVLSSFAAENRLFFAAPDLNDALANSIRAR